MTELDGELPETVKEIIDEFGVDVNYTITGDIKYNPATGKNEPTKQVVDGVKVTPPQAYSPIVVANSGGLIESKDLKFVTASLYFDNQPIPTAADFFIFNGERVAIIDVNPIYSGTLACAYELQGRL